MYSQYAEIVVIFSDPPILEDDLRKAVEPFAPFYPRRGPLHGQDFLFTRSDGDVVGLCAGIGTLRLHAHPQRPVEVVVPRDMSVSELDLREAVNPCLAVHTGWGSLDGEHFGAGRSNGEERVRPGPLRIKDVGGLRLKTIIKAEAGGFIRADTVVGKDPGLTAGVRRLKTYIRTEVGCLVPAGRASERNLLMVAGDRQMKTAIIELFIRRKRNESGENKSHCNQY